MSWYLQRRLRRPGSNEAQTEQSAYHRGTRRKDVGLESIEVEASLRGCSGSLPCALLTLNEDRTEADAVDADQVSAGIILGQGCVLGLQPTEALGSSLLIVC